MCIRDRVTLSIYDGQLYQKSLEELNFFTERVDGELKKVEELSFDLAMDYEICLLYTSRCV